MKKRNSILRSLIVLLIFSCVAETKLFAQNKYKGGSKHAQPSIDILPKSTDYILDRRLEDTLGTRLNQKIDELFDKHKIAGITATVLIPEKGYWEINKGFISKADNTIVDDSSIFYWASVGKLITSTLIHKLIEEDKLSLDDKLSKWYPDIQNAKKITIEQLLNHTNGIYSFNADSTVHYSKKQYSPNELLEVSKAHKNLFKPGEYWSYTNTGYMLLALILEKVESKTFELIVQERIVEPLNLKSLKVAPKKLPSNLALAHDKDTVIPKDSSGPMGAGNIIGNSKDMAVFLSALLTGEIISTEMVSSMMKDLYPMFDNGQYYGEGIMLYDFNEINNTETVWIGHSGGTENYKAVLLFDIKSKVIMAISINENIPAEAVALKLVEFINE
ncbi:serine hydrolase domain-containing protein [Zobellia barbeyronii]|uniref:Beta-lactamase family protein n=1 Tax=Zobellia barbeyronii TaxID=2748009 RepID=A0ABS5WB24_9FLAO|nr:serine hydrolase domain-containing protein [Zobellia barbeyronii]MBT2160596.1 beta-lactamase family protein [Zobellia barbeyronii]